jgi:hypothetical protein
MRDAGLLPSGNGKGAQDGAEQAQPQGRMQTPYFRRVASVTKLAHMGRSLVIYDAPDAEAHFALLSRAQGAEGV